ncbi:MAG TPA: hypothetical protein VGC09_22160 [Rhodopila sp.]
MADSTMAMVAGYGRPNDGGGGVFLWQPGSTEHPDDVAILAHAGQSAGRWIRQWQDAPVAPEIAGAVGDGVTDDQPAFNRLIALSHTRGAFTIALTTGRHYYMATTLDLSAGAPGLALAGPASPRVALYSGITAVPVTRIELNATDGATIKLGNGQVLRDVLVWRHGLEQAPGSLADVRAQVTTWFGEDGTGKKLSVGIFVPFDDTTVEGCMVVGFHTGIRASGGRFKLRHNMIDAGGYAVEVSKSKDTSLIEDVQTRALWSLPAAGRDAFGDHSYRPGTGFYIHDGADGLQVNSVMSIGWVNGIWLAGSTDGSPSHDDWLISLFQPNIETPSNNGHASAGIKTTGGVRRLTIIDPRIVAGGGDADSAALDFGQEAGDPTSSANNNVTVIGGTLEVASRVGGAVLLRQGSTGTLMGVTMNQINSRLTGTLLRALPGAGEWHILQPEVRGDHAAPWLHVDPGIAERIKITTPASAPETKPDGGRHGPPPKP